MTGAHPWLFILVDNAIVHLVRRTTKGVAKHVSFRRPLPGIGNTVSVLLDQVGLVAVETGGTCSSWLPCTEPVEHCVPRVRWEVIRSDLNLDSIMVYPPLEQGLPDHYGQGKTEIRSHTTVRHDLTRYPMDG